MKKSTTQKQLADLEEKCRILLQHINRWREAQLAYMPAVASLVAKAAAELLSAVESGTLAVENIPLFLPSSLSLDFCNNSGLTGLLVQEVRLRIAQADDALANIRHHLRIISGLWQFKKVNVSGTGNRPNTRMRTLYNRINHRMKNAVLCYHAAYSALLAADPKGKWQDRLKDLKQADVRGPGKDDFYMEEPNNAASGASKGRFEISWIWLVPCSKSEVNTNRSEQVFDEGMHVEWSKSQARKDRWEEEVNLILEEMRRTVVYYEWKQLWWMEQGRKRLSGEDSMQDGISAYAQKQAYYCKCLAERFAVAWLPFLESEGIATEWGMRYIQLIANKSPNATVVSTNASGDSDQEEDNVTGEEDGEEREESNVCDLFEIDD